MPAPMHDPNARLNAGHDATAMSIGTSTAGNHDCGIVPKWMPNAAR